jgi:ATP-dependent protease ClpP protease subunit
MSWFLTPDAKKELEIALANRTASFDGGVPQASIEDVLHVSGAQASIEVKGVLMKETSFFHSIFFGGGTSYTQIIGALSQADLDPNVDSIVLQVDSPGGNIKGLYETVQAIQNTKKPVTARISDLGASAAYILASAADTIIAANAATEVGSIGVAVTAHLDDQSVTITSTEAPDKRPDASTEEGQAAIRAHLDTIHELFVTEIATGRDTTIEDINANYGRGGTLLAEEALKRGMIDAIGSLPQDSANPGGKQPESARMDITLLKAQHPDVYAAAVQLGVAQERDRVGAHLKMGETSGDTATASKAIIDGSEMTATLQATYMSAAMDKRDIAQRQSENTSAESGSDGSAGADDKGHSDVASRVEALLGLEAE